MRSSLLALLMLTLLAPPAFAHSSHDHDAPAATEEQKKDTAPAAPTPKPTEVPAEDGAKKEPASDSQAAPKPAAPNKEP